MKKLLALLLIASCSFKDKEVEYNYMCENLVTTIKYKLNINMQNETMLFKQVFNESSGYPEITFAKDFVNGKALINASLDSSEQVFLNIYKDNSLKVESLSFNKLTDLAYLNLSEGKVRIDCKKIESLI
tara:strand:+ start:95 stop:481 length:387 start_codon:yes stop_codon:yes gene_type:complete